MKQRLADYVADFLVSHGVTDVFSVVGGGAMHLNDALGHNEGFGCHTFVGAGSQAEYGRVEGVLKPNTPAFPEMGYGIAKLCAGQMTREHAHQLGLRHIWMRILSVYGPNDGTQSMVMSTIKKLPKGEIPKFTQGEQMWDYLFSGDARSLAEYIEDIRDVVNPNGKIELEVIPYAPRQVMYLQADIEELVKDTSWSPKETFKKGIEKTLKRGYRYEHCVL